MNKTNACRFSVLLMRIIRPLIGLHFLTRPQLLTR
jgi:hypothetical protein